MFSKLQAISFFSLSLVATTIAFNNCSGQFAVQSGLKGSTSLASQGEDIPLVLGFESTAGDVFTNANPSVGFTVTGDSKDYVLKCYINSVQAATCASPIDLSKQSDGDQAVRIVAESTSGRTIKEVSRIFKIDRTAPVLTITSRPAAQISSLATSVLFTVKDNVSVAADITVQCALDAATYADCVSPKDFSGLTLGAHTIKLKAKDKAGNVSPETSIPFSVVVGLPIVNITAAPTAYINSTTASFTFSATSTDSTIASYECSIDNGVTYTTCTSPKSYTALENRAYNFAVRAKDAINQVSGAATRQFTVDTVAPSTPTVSSNLMSPSNQTSLSLTFASTDASGIASYQCAQDAGVFAACTSPKTFAVTAGRSTFKVKSTDAAGNVSQEGTYSIVIDTAAPVLEITSGPANPTTDTSAMFAFTASDTPAGVKTVECRLDTEASYSNCASSKSYATVALGNRSFSVRASDNAGNMVTKTYAWTVSDIVREPAATPTPPAATPPPAGQVLAGDIVDSAGTVDAAAYKSMAAQLSADAGIAYRYGPDASTYGNTGNAGLPTYYERPSIKAVRTGYYQGGGPETIDAAKFYATGDFGDPGNYSSNMGNVAFVADSPSTISGVGSLGIADVVYNTYDQQPRVSWTRSGDGISNFEEDNARFYRSKGLSPKNPVAIGRCNGQAGACPTGLAVYQNGLVSVYEGSNTAHNTGSDQLAPGKVPTSVTITNAGEFGLITVWDTVNLKGQVAVVALAGLCQDCDPFDPTVPVSRGGRYDYWHEWRDVYPGLMNKGDFAYIKILGYIDLPEMKAPTEIAVTTGLNQWDTMLFTDQGYVGGWGFPLTVESNRQAFVGTGPFANSYSKGGVAVVISKSEKKVTFIDLKPLFTYVNSVYFGGTQTTFQSIVNNLGPADSQWPHTFTYKPQQMPQVIKTITLTDKPTAVKTTLWGANPRAWVATQTGQLKLYSLGNYATGGTAAATDIAEKGTVAVGKNPTGLSHSKFDTATGVDINNQVLVVSRGERKVQWVRFSADKNSGSIVRTLQDSRIVDPISIDDGDNFFNQIPIVTISDYGGRKVSNYRFGKVIFGQSGVSSVGGIPWACQGPVGCGMGISGTDSFEFGGSFAVPGKPFQNVGANVP